MQLAWYLNYTNILKPTCVLYQSARQAATEAAPAAHVTVTAAAPLNSGVVSAATSGVGSGCEHDAVRVCVYVS